MNVGQKTSHAGEAEFAEAKQQDFMTFTKGQELRRWLAASHEDERERSTEPMVYGGLSPDSADMPRMSIGVVVDCQGTARIEHAGNEATVLQGLRDWLLERAKEGTVGFVVVQGEVLNTVALRADAGEEELDLSLKTLVDTDFCADRPTLDVLVEETRKLLRGHSPRLLVVVTDRLLASSGGRDPLALESGRTRLAAAWFAAVQSDRHHTKIRDGIEVDNVYFEVGYGKPDDKPSIDRRKVAEYCPATANLRHGPNWLADWNSWYYWYDGPRPLTAFLLLEADDDEDAADIGDHLAQLDTEFSTFLSNAMAGGLARGDESGPDSLFFRLFPLPHALGRCELGQEDNGELGVVNRAIAGKDDATCKVLCEGTSGAYAGKLIATALADCQPFAIVRPDREMDVGQNPCSTQKRIQIDCSASSSVGAFPNHADLPKGVLWMDDGRLNVDCSAFKRWLGDNPESATSFRVVWSPAPLEVRGVQLPEAVTSMYSAPAKDEASAPCRIAGLEQYLTRLVNDAVGFSSRGEQAGRKPLLKFSNPLEIEVSFVKQEL